MSEKLFVTQEPIHRITYAVRLNIENRGSGILLPGTVKEDMTLTLGFDAMMGGGREAFLARMGYMYDTMQRSINERKNYIKELGGERAAGEENRGE